MSKTRVTVVAVATLTAVMFGLVSVVAAQQKQSFTDVPTDAYYYEPAEWALEHGITLGCNPPDNDKFCPSASLTRAHMITFLWRYHQKFGGVVDQAPDEPISETSSPTPANSSSGSWNGTGRTVADAVTLPAGVYRVSLTVSGNTFGSSSQFSGSVRLVAVFQSGSRRTLLSTTGAGGTWEAVLTVDEDSALLFEVGGVEQGATWSLTYADAFGAS